MIPETNNLLHRRLRLRLSVPYSRGYFGCVPMLRLTQPVLEAFTNETKVSGRLETWVRHRW